MSTSQSTLDTIVAHDQAYESYPYPPLAEALDNPESFIMSDVAQDNRELCDMVASINFALSVSLRMQIMTFLMNKDKVRINDLMTYLNKDRGCIEGHMLYLQNAGLIENELQKHKKFIRLSPLGKSWMRKQRLW
jgi:hypothetical protein